MKVAGGILGEAGGGGVINLFDSENIWRDGGEEGCVRGH